MPKQILSTSTLGYFILKYFKIGELQKINKWQLRENDWLDERPLFKLSTISANKRLLKNKATYKT